MLLFYQARLRRDRLRVTDFSRALYLHLLRPHRQTGAVAELVKITTVGISAKRRAIITQETATITTTGNWSQACSYSKQANCEN